MAATVGEAVYDRLATTAPDLSDAVGGRIYPQLATQEAEYPFVVYTVVGREDVRGLTGSRDLARYAVRIDCYAATEAGAVAVGDLVLAAFAGTWAGGGIVGVFRGDQDIAVTEDAIRVWSHTFDIWFAPT